jgi:hypothetical protein
MNNNLSISLKSLRRGVLFAVAMMAGMLPATAQQHAYQSFTTDVPFKFNIGDQTYKPGEYQFVVAGVNLLAVRDAKEHTLAMLVTQSVDTGALPPASKVVFKKGDKHLKLAGIVIANRSEALEIVGKYNAQRQDPFQTLTPWEADVLFQRNTTPPFTSGK